MVLDTADKAAACAIGAAVKSDDWAMAEMIACVPRAARRRVSRSVSWRFWSLRRPLTCSAATSQRVLSRRCRRACDAVHLVVAIPATMHATVATVVATVDAFDAVAVSGALVFS